MMDNMNVALKGCGYLRATNLGAAVSDIMMSK
jgi:hypothetical protein